MYTSKVAEFRISYENRKNPSEAALAAARFQHTVSEQPVVVVGCNIVFVAAQAPRDISISHSATVVDFTWKVNTALRKDCTCVFKVLVR